MVVSPRARTIEPAQEISHNHPRKIAHQKKSMLAWMAQAQFTAINFKAQGFRA
jgi:hypothetical protein